MTDSENEDNDILVFVSPTVDEVDNVSIFGLPAEKVDDALVFDPPAEKDDNILVFNLPAEEVDNTDSLTFAFNDICFK